ncbi:MAG: hypothetical protein FIA92_08020 [Chloroflexi bacterium]|nr:hypothetical protein [Chloroflexota bacterium]
MGALTTLAMVLALGLLAGTSIAYVIAKGPEVVASIFGRPHAPSWPRGVQEEDPPPQWRFDDRDHST